MTTVKHCVNNVIMEVDPLNKYGNVSDDKLHEACGYLLPWAILGADASHNNIKSMEQNLVDAYIYFSGWNQGKHCATVSDDGTYSYPQDPDMYPYVTLHKGTETVHIYPYGIVTVREDDNATYRTTRMD